jgi:hypothetical protein
MLTHVFFGERPMAKRALVVAGLHPSELSGIEVANWIRVRLDKARSDHRFPLYTVLLIPEVFPLETAQSRAWEAKKASKASKHPYIPNVDDTTYRYVKRDQDGNFLKGKDPGIQVNANRQFPVPGTPLSTLLKNGGPSGPNKRRLLQDPTDPNKKGAVKIPRLPEMVELMSLIEWFQPHRIASLHGKRPSTMAKPKGKQDNPGIFVDPRYTYDRARCPNPQDLNPCKFDKARDPAFGPVAGIKKDRDTASRSREGQREDDPLCLRIAEKAWEKGAEVPGNYLDPGDAPPVVHYTQSGGGVPGFSLGDWGPVRVTEPSGDPGLRDGAPVITVEPYKYYESGAFVDGKLILATDSKDKLRLDPVALVHATSPAPPGQQGAGTLMQMLEASLKGIIAHVQDLRIGRANELRAHADAMVEIFLELPPK